MEIEIDVKQFARDIKSGKEIGGTDGALSSLVKQLTESAPRVKIILIYLNILIKIVKTVILQKL